MNTEFQGHQGSILEHLAHRSRIPVAKLASILGTSRGYIYNCFNKQLLSSEIIYQACNIFRVPVSIFFTSTPQVDLSQVLTLKAYDSFKDIGTGEHRDIYLSRELAGKSVIVAIMRTDVMYPAIHPGDHLYLGESVTARQILDSFIYLVKSDDMVTVGRVRVQGDILWISFDNPVIEYTSIAASLVLGCYPLLALSRVMSPVAEKTDDPAGG